MTEKQGRGGWPEGGTSVALCVLSSGDQRRRLAGPACSAAHGLVGCTAAVAGSEWSVDTRTTPGLSNSDKPGPGMGAGPPWITTRRWPRGTKARRCAEAGTSNALGVSIFCPVPGQIGWFSRVLVPLTVSLLSRRLTGPRLSSQSCRASATLGLTCTLRIRGGWRESGLSSSSAIFRARMEGAQNRERESGKFSCSVWGKKMMLELTSTISRNRLCAVYLRLMW